MNEVVFGIEPGVRSWTLFPPELIRILRKTFANAKGNDENDHSLLSILEGNDTCSNKVKSLSQTPCVSFVLGGVHADGCSDDDVSSDDTFIRMYHIPRQQYDIHRTAEKRSVLQRRNPRNPRPSLSTIKEEKFALFF